MVDARNTTFQLVSLVGAIQQQRARAQALCPPYPQIRCFSFVVHSRFHGEGLSIGIYLCYLALLQGHGQGQAKESVLLLALLLLLAWPSPGALVELSLDHEAFRHISDLPKLD